MPKVKTQQTVVSLGYERKNYSVKYDIFVDSEGKFTTTLPEDCVELLERSGKRLDTNLRGRKGFYSGKTMDQLTDTIKKDLSDALKGKIIEEEIVLRYAVKASATWTESPQGDIFPNGYYSETRINDGTHDFTNWKSGTTDVHANSSEAYGILLFIRPFRKEVWEYPGGKIVKEYAYLHDTSPECEEDENLKWLCRIVGIGPDDLHPIQDISYTPDAALFFVNLTKGIMGLVRQVAMMKDTENVQKFIEHGLPTMLGNG